MLLFLVGRRTATTMWSAPPELSRGTCQQSPKSQSSCTIFRTGRRRLWNVSARAAWVREPPPALLCEKPCPNVRVRAGVCVSAVIEGNCSGNVTHGWATHGADVPFVEGSQIYYTAVGEERGRTSARSHACNQTEGEVALSDRMQEYWATFAKTGRPSAAVSGGPSWPAFAEHTGGLVMQLDVGEFSGVREGLKASQCAFWEKVAPLGPRRRQVEE